MCILKPFPTLIFTGCLQNDAKKEQSKSLVGNVWKCWGIHWTRREICLAWHYVTGVAGKGREGARNSRLEWTSGGSNAPTQQREQILGELKLQLIVNMRRMCACGSTVATIPSIKFIKPPASLRYAMVRYGAGRGAWCGRQAGAAACKGPAETENKTATFRFLSMFRFFLCFPPPIYVLYCFSCCLLTRT